MQQAEKQREGNREPGDEACQIGPSLLNDDDVESVESESSYNEGANECSVPSFDRHTR